MPADNQQTNISTENQQTELNRVVQRFRQLCDNLKSECGIDRFGLRFGCGPAKKKVGFWIYSDAPLQDSGRIMGPWLQEQMKCAGIPETERAVEEPHKSRTEGNIANSYVHYTDDRKQSLSELELSELESRFNHWTAFFKNPDFWPCDPKSRRQQIQSWNEKHLTIIQEYIEKKTKENDDPEAREEFKDVILDCGEIMMKDIPDVDYPEDVVSSADVEDPVLSWVTSVNDLFERKPIELQDKRRMGPGKYVIPAYQRKYAWEARQIGQLCRDLLHAANSRPDASYHLGTLIFHRDAKNDFFYVVDGQQRLTTISRLIGRKIFHEEINNQQFTDKDKRLIADEFRKYVESDQEKIQSVLARCTFVCIAVTDITESFQLFSTQNGRGRPLSPVNLLKAFHFHEINKLSGTALGISEDKCKKIDMEWEARGREKTPRDGRLLSQVVGEHLYRLRNWCRGVFPEKAFSNASIDEFKGLTMDSGDNAKIPLQNLAVLRHKFYNDELRIDEQMFARRSKNDGMNHFVSVDQPIINGEDFFAYAISYAKAYDLLFRNGIGMEEFRNFHRGKCCYPKSSRRGDTYARHVFESLAMFCFDRFGKEGLVSCMRELYCCAYYERLVKSRCYYSTCGSEFSVKAVRCMLCSMTLPILKDRLQDLCLEVREKIRERFKDDGKLKLPDGIETVKSVFDGK